MGYWLVHRSLGKRFSEAFGCAFVFPARAGYFCKGPSTPEGAEPAFLPPQPYLVVSQRDIPFDASTSIMYFDTYLVTPGAGFAIRKGHHLHFDASIRLYLLAEYLELWEIEWHNNP